MRKDKLFTLCASSNLLEPNACWNKLKDTCNLSFESYGEFISPLLKKKDSGFIFVLFLEDLINNIDGTSEILQNKYNSFVQGLEKRAISSDEPIIICIATNHDENILSNIRQSSNIKNFYKWLMNELSILRDNYKSIYLLDLNEIFYPFGSKEIFSDRNWYFARCRLSVKGLNILTDALLQVINRFSNAASKVLVLDCDNTLWGGIIGEDGLQGIILGQDGIGTAYVDFQREIVKLENNGIIIVLASKNNDKDVWEVFDKHSDMYLKREHIVTSKINWNEKAFNLQEVAKELDLGLDSFVFWDDNPLERDKMRTLLPQVLTVDVPNDIVKWPRLLRTINCFAKFNVTAEDKKKSNQYKSRAKFINDLKGVDDIKTYLTSLNLSPETFQLNETNIARAEQLCIKTNQFNVRTKRHTAADLQNLKKDNQDFVFLVKLGDKYGDHGIVSLVCLSKIDDDLIFLDTFLMSCRVLGRHLEAWILSEIVKRIKKENAKFLIAEFVDTKRNSLALQFLNTYGFEKVTQGSDLSRKINSNELNTKGTIYCLDVKDLVIPNLEIYGVSKNES